LAYGHSFAAAIWVETTDKHDDPIVYPSTGATEAGATGAGFTDAGVTGSGTYGAT